MTMYRCLHCGARMELKDIPTTTVWEDYGDVLVAYCPHCKEIEYDGYELFKEVKEKSAD